MMQFLTAIGLVSVLSVIGFVFLMNLYNPH